MPVNYPVPTRAEIYEHAQGSLEKLDNWLESQSVPEEAKKLIYSDLASYSYEEE